MTRTVHPLSRAYKKAYEHHLKLGGTSWSWCRRNQLISAAPPNDREEGKLLKDLIKAGDEQNVVDHLNDHESEEYWMNGGTERYETLKEDLDEGIRLARRYGVLYHLLDGKPHEKRKYMVDLIARVRKEIKKEDEAEAKKNLQKQNENRAYLNKFLYN